VTFQSANGSVFTLSFLSQTPKSDAKVETKVTVSRHPWCPLQDSASLHQALQHARLHKPHPQGPGAHWKLVPSMLDACARGTSVLRVAYDALI